MPKYARGEKVFAKVRGYPPWPARVEGVADETPNKMKYHIYFYGTAETAICKADELFAYVENRAKYGKPIKKRGFNEALQQVDEELGLSDNSLLENSALDNSETSVTPTGIAGKEGLGLHKTETPMRRKLDIQDNLEQEGKKSNNSGKKPKNNNDQSQTPVTGKQQEVVSRSGRKIKPKKFADEQVDDNSGTPFAVANHSTSVSNVNKSVDDISAVSNNDVTTVVPEQTLSTASTTFSVEKLKKETEEYQEDDTQEKTKQESKEKLSTTRLSDSNGIEKLIPESLATEGEILRIDVGIKDSLDLKRAHPERALVLLDELLELKVNRLMFKKHPEVVDTVTKLCKYVGCAQNWNLTDDEVKDFNEKATQIQEKAKNMLQKIESLFVVPEDKSFAQYYKEQLIEFAKITENWNQEDVFKLMVDPTDENEA